MVCYGNSDWCGRVSAIAQGTSVPCLIVKIYQCQKIQRPLAPLNHKRNAEKFLAPWVTPTAKNFSFGIHATYLHGSPGADGGGGTHSPADAPLRQDSVCGTVRGASPSKCAADRDAPAYLFVGADIAATARAQSNVYRTGARAGNSHSQWRSTVRTSHRKGCPT